MSCILKPELTIHTIPKKGSISNVSIPWLSRQGGEELVITGMFDEIDNPSILIDGKNCEQVKKVNSSQITCVTPSNSKIKNIDLKILKFNKVVASYPLKYIGVLGQASTKSVIQKARGFNYPVLVKKIDSKLFIGDYGNSRVVGFYNSINISQRDFDFSLRVPHLNEDFGKLGNLTSRFIPRDIDYKDGLFMFADGENNRVLIFDGIPSLNQKPKIILGQPDYESGVINNGGLSAKSLYKPMYAKFIDGKIFVSDSLNNRILVWNSLPTSNFQNADYILGQPDFTTNTVNTGGTSANSLNYPIGIDKIGNKFYVADQNNGRILIWDSLPLSNVGANKVLGQADLTSKLGLATNNRFLGPISFNLVNDNFFVIDAYANRILVYKNFNLNNADFSSLEADIVLGQPDFTSSAVFKDSSDKITAQSLNQPSKLEIYEGKMFVADTYHHRVLVYNHVSDNVLSDQNQAADEVIGQESFSMSGSRRIMFGAKYLSRPSSIAFHEGKLLVNSESQGRISIWNTIPEDDFIPADFVLGQSGFTENDISPNRGGALPTSSSLNGPYQMLTFDQKLLVSDFGNNRILVWNDILGTNGQIADLVIGQNDFVSKVTNPVSDFTLSDPIGMDIVDNKLVVADRGNHRMLVYNSFTTVNSPAADVVIGQSNFSNSGVFSSTPIPHNVNGKNFYSPFNSVSWLGKYLVADHNTRRVLLWNSFDDFINGSEAVSVWGQNDLTSYDWLTFIGKNKSSTYITVRVVDDVLYVVDPYNNRILEFKNLPFGINLVPTGVVGQKDFISNNYINENNFSATSFNLPVGIYSIENRTYIADYLNDRVLILPK